MAEAAGLNPVQRGFDPRRGYCTDPTDLQSSRMGPHFEDEPDDDPDEPEQPGGPDGAAATAGPMLSVGLPAREWEFSTQVLTVAQVVDGTTLAKLVQESGAEGWELSDVIDGGDKRVLLLRRPKRSTRESRRVGFAPPTNN